MNLVNLLQQQNDRLKNEENNCKGTSKKITKGSNRRVSLIPENRPRSCGALYDDPDSEYERFLLRNVCHNDSAKYLITGRRRHAPDHFGKDGSRATNKCSSETGTEHRKPYNTERETISKKKTGEKKKLENSENTIQERYSELADDPT